MAPAIILASASPRRQALLTQIGVTYSALHADIDETPDAGEVAGDYVTRMALEKARTGRQMSRGGHELPVLGADTAIEVDGEILTKPENKSAAIDMLMKLSDRQHRVYTAVALLCRTELTRLSITTVTFRSISAQECRAYWDSGEPCGKAGGYAIQGVGAVFVRCIEGSYSGVMGLPLFETAELLQHCGIKILASHE